MKRRSTRWLVAAAAVLYLFILLVERRSERSGGGGENPVLFPPLDVSGIRAVRLRMGTNEMLSFERGTNTWFAQSPFLYPAESEGVTRLIRGVAGLRKRGVIRPAEVRQQTGGLGAFGLAPAAATITLANEDDRFVLHLGKQTAVGREIYAQIAGQEDLLLLEDAILGLLPSGPEAWRDRALLHLDDIPIDRVQVRPLTNGFEVIRDPQNRTWQMTKPWPTRANSSRLEYLLQELRLLRVSGFVRDTPTAEELVAFGLQPAQREIVFGLGSKDVQSLEVGLPAPGETNLLYVRSSRFGNVMLTPRAPLAPWLDTSREGYTEFCDRRLMVFNLDQVDRIVIRADESFVLQRGPGSGWRILEPFAAPADAVLVIEMLAEMAGLEFLALEREVVTDFASYGLAPPRRSYRLEHTVRGEAGPTNEVIAQVDFGNPSGHRYFARRRQEDSVVLALDPVRLPKAAFQLRERQVWDLSTNQIAAITVSQGAQSRRLVRTGPMQWTLAEGPGAQPHAVTLEEAAYLLGQLRADRWVAVGRDSLSRYGFVEDGHQVIIEPKPGVDAAARFVVRFGSPSPSGRLYAAVEIRDQPGPVIFECPPRLREFILNDLNLGAVAAQGDQGR